MNIAQVLRGLLLLCVLRTLLVTRNMQILISFDIKNRDSIKKLDCVKIYKR